MTPTKLLIGQILVVFAIVIAGLWVATQWAAAMLAYQPELGPAWFRLFGTPVYRPWAIFLWWYHFDAYAPHVFDKAGALAGASGFIGCGAAIAGSLWRARQSRNVTTYGSARWAKPNEIEKAGLFNEAGVFLGRQRGRYLRHDGPEHVMTFAPTRSGKGVGLVVPTLLSWTGSAVIHDFIDAYNFGRRLKILRGLTPYEYICKCWTNEPDRFNLNPHHQMPGLNT